LLDLQTSKTFLHDDQLAFAELSGDYNPLHVDPLQSRRLLYGEQVVHGIHLVLWGLDRICGEKTDSYSIENLNCVFKAPCRLDDSVELKIYSLENGQACCLFTQKHAVVCEMSVELSKIESQQADDTQELEQLYDLCNTDLSKLSMASGAIDICCKRESVRERFESLYKSIPLQQVSVLISLSTLVGMVCPGRDSVFSEFEINRKKNNDINKLNYTVCNFDDRFNRIQISIKAPHYEGIIISFLRPKPYAVPTYADIRNSHKISCNGKKALVVGGSRGIGAVATKMLASAGAEVYFTYYKCKAEAESIMTECNSSGANTRTFAFDILDTDPSPLEFQPDMFLYFATPNAFRGVAGHFSEKLYNQYYEYYVNAFLRLVTQYCTLKQVGIFYPSSVAIDENVPAMQEYIKAKTVGEKCCSQLQREHSKWSVLSPRLPRTMSDQTNSIFAVNNADPVQLLAGYMKQLVEV